MKIKLDESLTRRLQSPLRELGHDVCTVADEGLLGSPDREKLPEALPVKSG